MKPQTQRKLRQFHLYLGVFFAPAILFFAFSGMLQTFSFHEAKGYAGAPPPGWIATIGSIHKDQRLPRAKVSGGDKEHRDEAGKSASPPRPTRPAIAPGTLPLKIFTGIMSIGLMFSALLGITIALTNRTTRRVSLIMLAAGTLLPIGLLLG